MTASWVGGLFEREGAAHADDDEFGGTTLDAAWTPVVGGGNHTVTVADGLLSSVFVGQAANQTCGIVKPIAEPTLPKTIETVVRIFGLRANTRPGLVFAEGPLPSDKALSFFASDRREDSSAYGVARGPFNGATGLGGWTAAPIYSPLYLRFVWTTHEGLPAFTTIASADGVTWTKLGGPSPYSDPPVPSHYGLRWSATPTTGTAAFEYFRVYDEDLSDDVAS